MHPNAYHDSYQHDLFGCENPAEQSEFRYCLVGSLSITLLFEWYRCPEFRMQFCGGTIIPKRHCSVQLVLISGRVGTWRSECFRGGLSPLIAD
jgi:hypothetical protein